MSAGLAQMEELCAEGLYEALAAKTKRIAEGFKAAANKHGIPMSINYVGGMFGLFFTEEETVTRFDQVTKCDAEKFPVFYHGMLDEGVYLAPSAYEAGFLSMAHGEKELEETLAAADRVFAKMAK
jgi:glutamate-1-semialdehyde 2,1-aminomutase